MRSSTTFVVVALLGAVACTSDESNRNRPPEASVSTQTPAAPAPVAAPAAPMLPLVPPKTAASPELATAPATAALDSRAERLEALRKEYGDAMNAYYDLYRNAKTEEESRKVSETAKPPDSKAYLARAQALLDENPADDVALEAITWMLENSRGGADHAPLIAAIEAHHAQSEKLADLCRMLVDDPSPKGEALVQRLLSTSPHANVRGNACYWLAKSELRQVDSARRVRGMKEEQEIARWKEYLGAEKFERMKSLDAEAATKQAEALLERVVKEFADVPYFKGTLGEQAQSDLYEMRELALGKTAPDIVGEDLASTAFKLGDYRGKVVMLDFWGNW